MRRWDLIPKSKYRRMYKMGAAEIFQRYLVGVIAFNAYVLKLSSYTGKVPTHPWSVLLGVGLVGN